MNGKVAVLLKEKKRPEARLPGYLVNVDVDVDLNLNVDVNVNVNV